MCGLGRRRCRVCNGSERGCWLAGLDADCGGNGGSLEVIGVLQVYLLAELEGDIGRSREEVCGTVDDLSHDLLLSLFGFGELQFLQIIDEFYCVGVQDLSPTVGLGLEFDEL